MPPDFLLLELEQQRDAALAEMAIDAETRLINIAEDDGISGRPPQFPEDPTYWAAYSEGARLFWIHHLDRFALLPDEF